MSLPRISRFLLIAVFALFGFAPFATAVAQDAAPVVVASGLTNPRGFTWGADGTLFVALAGSGGTTPAVEDAPTTAAVGPFLGGTTGAVVSIGADGCPVPVVTGLPSTVDNLGGVLGAEDVAILGDQLYAGVDGGGPVHGDGALPSGVYRLLADGTFEVVADLSAWVRANPVAELPGDSDPDAAGYSLVADEASGVLWVGDPNSGQILSVSPDGTVTRVADLSAGHPVPTRMVADPEGGVYVGTLTASPFTDGTAKVMHVAADGTATDVWTNLTTVVDVAVGADGTLYALEMSTGNSEQAPLNPGTGQLVMQTGPDTAEVVAGGLMFPVAMEIGPDGNFYIAMPALGANGGEGAIAVIAGAGTPVAAPTAAACSPIPETLSAAPAGTPEAAPASPAAEEAAVTEEAAVATPPAGDAGESSPEASPASDVSGNTVTIQDFTFGPATLEITAGTTVTFTNMDSASHTATADDGSWDTGTIDGGASATLTFDTPGTYTYKCAFHPNMTGTIVVS
jgi:plastocyanin